MSLACAGADPAAGESWCIEMCGLYRRCEGPMVGCESQCPVDNGAYFARTHPDTLALEAQCFQASACESDTDVVFMDCSDQARELQAPTAESLAFCESMGTTFFDCNWFAGPLPCAQLFASSSGRALDDALACKSEACGDLENCLAFHLWGTE